MSPQTTDNFIKSRTLNSHIAVHRCKKNHAVYKCTFNRWYDQHDLIKKMVKMESFKVAFIHPDLGIGGAERLVLDVAVALADQGVEVEFVTNHFNKDHSFEELKNGRFKVTVIGEWIPKTICGSFRALLAYIKMLYLALVYCFFSFNKLPNVFFVDQIPMAVPIIKFTNRRVVYYCHHPDMLSSPPGGCLKKLYRKPIDRIEQYGTDQADKILVNSQFTAGIFKKTFPSIKQELTILYPSISAEFLKDITKAKKKPVHELAPEICREQPNDVTFLSINRFHPMKQITLAIEAIHELRGKLSADAFTRIHLILAGGFDSGNPDNKMYFKKLVGLTHQKGLIIKVVFLKSPTDKEKADLLKSCDCLLYTPVNEHFGIVPLEAMAAGKPVIACNSGGPRESVEHGVTGYLCEPNPESMAKYMIKMLDKVHAKKMGEKGFQRMHEMFSHDAFSKHCMDIINQTFISQK